ncbi:winged helix-turn-helix transcriptional regulator [Dyadobacter sediminis]|uniref:Helix-turn-helix transcriptional regulator n=1 Tax=Dyadobacter sediminis TaxID=1493691 RepID=A0A5R9K8A3_9BACT|nr:helix-turn-helix domain-containing protein [Dyadobacter sediminis]TLU90319.1 helix-turn-helix transcriptional regulator [Dyadobacter sediminis]GGC06829.1 HxlR family transcriptional regulator [Dyadobacter sediminis]
MKELKQRSTCPISTSLDVLGDKWTLLILRDMVFAGKCTYGQFLQSAEKMATNILADRLVILESQGILTKAVAADKKSKFTYRLTEKGVDTVPIIIELILWGAKHCPTVIDPGLLEELQNGKDVAVEKYQRLAREKSLA